MKCMLLAAGLGTRLQPFTLKVPKPALEILNVPLIYYSMELLKNVNPDTVVVNVHHLPDQMIPLIKKVGGIVSFEREKVLGSGGGIKNAEGLLKNVGGPLLCMNADNIIIPKGDSTLEELIEAHRRSSPLATLLVVKDSRVGSEFNGVWANREGLVKEIGIKPKDKNLSGYHFTGVAVYDDEIFSLLPEGESSIFKDGILPAIANEEKVQICELPVNWFETGDPMNFLNTSKELVFALKNTNKYLGGVVARRAPQSELIDCSGVPVFRDRSAKIHRTVEFRKWCVVGRDCQIDEGSIVESSVLLKGAQVGSQHISNRIID